MKRTLTFVNSLSYSNNKCYLEALNKGFFVQFLAGGFSFACEAWHKSLE